MKITENRPLAWAVLAVVVVLTLVIGGGNALKAKSDAVAAVFNAPNDSISYELKQMADNAEVMATIAESTDGVDMAQVAAVTTAVEDIRSAKSVSESRKAYVSLKTAVESLYSGATALSMTETNAGDFEYKYKNFSSAYQSAERYPEYNEAAEAFNKVRNGFPAVLISALRGIGQAELFN
ncbi:MAG: hypothetical protein IJJ23_01690 [Clostridia bacterium]|nr:hypothetical protein [Clostridia bacterium]